jgi:hypothetical protein
MTNWTSTKDLAIASVVADILRESALHGEAFYWDIFKKISMFCVKHRIELPDIIEWRQLVVSMQHMEVYFSSK